MSPKLISLQVGLPRTVPLNGEAVSTGIFKLPVAKRVQMRELNLDGDRQADLTVHGGRDKAIYGYPSEHYPYWRDQLPGVDLPWGSFGENLTTAGLLESEVHIGDRFTIGGAEVVIDTAAPSLLQAQSEIRSRRYDQAFLASHFTGFYFRVLREGEVGAGDEIVRVHRG